MHLSRDPLAINAVVNDPAVRPFVGAPDAGPIDVAPLVDCDLNLFPFGEHGGFALLWSAPGAREVHTFILPTGRGQWARDAAQEMIAMAGESGTAMLWTRIPADQPHVRSYAMRAGMKPTGETLDTFGKPYAVYSMECGSCH